MTTVQRSQRQERQLLLVQQAVDQRLHLVFPDDVDGRQHLVEGEERAEVELLLGQPAHPARGGLQREHQVPLQVILGPPELGGPDAVLLEVAELLQGQLQDFGEVRRVRRGVDVEEPGVVVGLGPRVDRVDQPLALPHLLEEARGHAAADDVVQDVERVPLRRRVGEPRKPRHDVHLLERLLDHLHGHPRRRRAAIRLGRGAFEPVEARGQEPQHAVVIGVPRHGHRDLPGGVLLLEVAEDGLPAQALDSLAGSEDGAAQRVAGPEAFGEQVVDQVVRRVLHHLDLLEDHRLLLLDVLRPEERVAQDVGEEVDRQRQVLVEHVDEEARVLLRGEGVHLAAHRVHRPGDLLGGPGLGALEDQVLDQVGNPAALGRLVPGARVHPDPDGDRPDVRHPLGDHADAVGEDALPVLFGHRLPSAARGSSAFPCRPAPAVRGAPSCGTAASCRSGPPRSP